MARDVAGCEAMLEHLAPGFAPRPLASLEEVEVAVAWTELADPLVGAAVEAVAARFPRCRRVELPFPDPATYAPFMREVADVHRELHAENADLYGEDVRIKLERCFAVRDAEVERGTALRAEYEERVEEELGGCDVVLTPTLPIVAPRLGAGGTGDLAVREALIRFTFPFSALGRPALALPCGTAEDGLPTSAQIAGRKGDDALVLAVGRLLEALLAT
jgi:Asp-tRNA(Asn)/Glu-tRNA(Gln) amidotransferase A subunit family amidase